MKFNLTVHKKSTSTMENVQKIDYRQEFAMLVFVYWCCQRDVCLARQTDKEISPTINKYKQNSERIALSF